MNRMVKAKLIIILLLCVLAIALYYFYTLSDDQDISLLNKEESLSQITNDKIIRGIDSIIYTFGIRKEWVKEAVYKDAGKKNKPLSFSKEVFIPNDLLIIDLNFEISNYLRSNNLVEKVTEDPRTKNLLMNIFSIKNPEQLIGNLKFIYSDSIERKASKVCTIFDSLEYQTLNDVENILKSTQEFSVLLPLRNDKAEYQSKIIDLKRDYLIEFIIGDKDNLIADFKNDMPENIWKSKVRSVALNFPQVSGIILHVDNGLNDFKIAIKEEFKKNNLNVFEDTLFSKYKRDHKVNSHLEDIVLKSNRGMNYLFYIVVFTPDEFNFYEKQIYFLKKLGYKFYNFKEIITEINEKIEKPENKISKPIN